MFPTMFAQNELARRSRSRLWINRLWILSAALGAATLGSGVVIVHDTGRQRASAAVVAKSRAEQIASAAAGRLEILALETFAPAAPWETHRSMPAKTVLEALVRAQRDAEQCRCRDTLPANTFFHFDVQSGNLSTATTSTLASSDPPTSVLEAIARAEANRAGTSGRSRAHFIATPPLGKHGIVTMVQSDEHGVPQNVFGLVSDAESIARAVFVGDSARSDALGPGLTLYGRDAVAVELKAEGAAPFIRALDRDRPFRATVSPAAGPLQGLAITAALTPRQAIRSLAVSPRELWHVGVLTMATILVIGFAIGSSGRELLLARARSDFIAGVSHDLRMPLAQILIASETLTLRREHDEAERLTLSSSIVREARRLISIVDNVLLFSRSGAVALRQRLEPLAVSTLFDDVIDAVRLAVEDSGQTIDANESSLGILGDRQLVRQALVNLVDNALKYGSPGQRILLNAERHAASAVRLYVEDEGPGVPPAERTRIFEPYERLARDQTSERTGTGLGLAVVRHIVQVCGGRVWLDESPRGGTRVVLELPVAELPASIAREKELV